VAVAVAVAGVIFLDHGHGHGDGHGDDHGDDHEDDHQPSL